MKKGWWLLILAVSVDLAVASDAAKNKWDAEATEPEKQSLMDSMAGLAKDTATLKANDSTLSIWGDKAIRFCGYVQGNIGRPDKRCYAAVMEAYDAYRTQGAQVTGAEPMVPSFITGVKAPVVTPTSPASGKKWVSAEPSREAVSAALGPKPKPRQWVGAEPSRAAVVKRLGAKPRPKT